MTDVSISVAHTGKHYSLSVKYMSEVELGTIAAAMSYYCTPTTDTPFQRELRDAIHEQLEVETFDGPPTAPVRDTDRVLADEIRQLTTQLNDKINSAVAFGLTIDIEVETVVYMSRGELPRVEASIYRKL